MHRFILTGAPGSGKTAVLRRLELDGFGVVEEAATDVIALAQAQGDDEPWLRPDFTDTVAALQRRRQLGADRDQTGPVSPAGPAGPVLFDRSPICTYALALHLGHTVGPVLAGELDRVRDERLYEHRVFFISGQEFLTPTPARRISLAEARRFEKLHAEVYQQLGYELVTVEPGPLDVRAARVRTQASTAAELSGF